LENDLVVIANQSIFAAERTLKKRKRKGKMQYKVKWLGYPEDQSTLKPEENILDRRFIVSMLCQLGQVVSVNR